MTRRILFVCLGNICRSPLAEGAFRALVEAEGQAGAFVVDSAGTADWHEGKPPDARAQEAARARGIDISGQRSRPVRAEDFETFDLILAMDEANRHALAAMAPPAYRDKVRMLLDFLPQTRLREVPDPYYGGPAGFARVFDLVEAAGRGLLASLQGARSKADDASASSG